jgi:hypothetical protein
VSNDIKMAVRPRRKLPNSLFAVSGAVLAFALALTVGKLSFGPPLVILSLGGMTLGLSGLALFRVLDPLLRNEAELALEPHAPARVRHLEREKQSVLKAIREIDLDYQMRKISETDYRELANRYRNRAMRLIREIDAGDDYRALIEAELKSRLAAEEARRA